MNTTRTVPLALLLLLPLALPARASSPVPVPPQAASGAGQGTGQATGQPAAPRQSGTVKAVTSHDLVLTTAAGQDYAVTVPEKTRVLLVPPGSHDLSAAQPGTIGDIAAGDRVIVSGTAGDAGAMLNATRVIVMKSNAIAATHAEQEAAWTHGAGGIVRSVDPSTGILAVANGAHTLTVDTSATTVVRRYAGASVRFEDAVKSTVAAVHPGDQIRVRGQHSSDGNTIVADEIVTGSFSNFSGVVSALDSNAGTVTLKDLATKRTVTVDVTPQSNVRRLPPGAAAMLAGHGRSDNATGVHGGQPPTATAQPAATAGTGRPGATGGDLSRMINRLPTETLAGLKPGDAVMIVAANNPQTDQPTAITLLVGVEQILAAHPTGETTLSPWSIGNTAGEGETGGAQ
ncbi:MAG: hypothetical protein ACRYFU_20550 [Janthinobacterium lividum]